MPEPPLGDTAASEWVKLNLLEKEEINNSLEEISDELDDETFRVIETVFARKLLLVEKKMSTLRQGARATRMLAETLEELIDRAPDA